MPILLSRSLRFRGVGPRCLLETGGASRSSRLTAWVCILQKWVCILQNRNRRQGKSAPVLYQSD